MGHGPRHGEGTDAATQHVRCCRVCGFAYRDPVWNDADIDLFYSAETWSLIPKPAVTDETIRNNVERRGGIRDVICKHVQGDATRRSIIDIGGRDGFYVAPFLDEEWHVAVADLNEAEPIDARIEKVSDISAPEVQGRFDAVVVSHVLEHVTDPMAFLQAIRAVLAPYGVVYVEVPFELVALLTRNMFGDPTHVSYWTSSTVELALERSGFRVEHLRRGPTTYDTSRLETVVAVGRRREAADDADADDAPADVATNGPGLWPVGRELLSGAGARVARRLRLSPGATTRRAG